MNSMAKLCFLKIYVSEAYKKYTKKKLNFVVRLFHVYYRIYIGIKILKLKAVTSINLIYALKLFFNRASNLYFECINSKFSY